MRFAGDRMKGGNRPMPQFNENSNGGDFNRQQNFRQGVEAQRQDFRNNQKSMRQDQRSAMKEARAGGASREELKQMRQSHRQERQSSRQGFRENMKRNRTQHRSNMRNDRMLDRHFDSGGPNSIGAAVVTHYKDNKTGKTVRTPSGNYQPKDSNRWTKVESPEIRFGGGGGMPEPDWSKVPQNQNKPYSFGFSM